MLKIPESVVGQLSVTDSSWTKANSLLAVNALQYLHLDLTD